MTENGAWQRIAVLGDSIAVHQGDTVDGYPTETWAEQVAPALAPDEYVNLGVSGARAAEIRAGQLAAALAFGPDLAFVAAGANDAVRASFRPDHVEAELDAMIGPLSRAGALVVTLGCFDLSATLGADVGRRLRTLGDLTARLSRRHGGLHVNFADHPRGREGVFGADGLHINARGHAIVATTLLTNLANVVSASSSPSRSPAPASGPASGPAPAPAAIQVNADLL
jgi:lysophospholipase L1-like esterase